MRADREKGHRGEFERNRKKILATQEVCGICDRFVDKSIKFPDPMSPTVDHIIPVAKNGHPSAIENLQLAHRCCNREKSDKIVDSKQVSTESVLSNRLLPLSLDWGNFNKIF